MCKTFIIGFLLAMTTFNEASSQQPLPTSTDFAWILGTWQRQQVSRPLFESWLQVDSTQFSGKGFMLNRKDTTVTEQMKLLFSDTAVFFVAEVKHNDSAIFFRLVSLDSSGAIFENLKHDYPTRVIYQPLAPDSMHARIEGVLKGKVTGVDFLFERLNSK